MTRTLAVDYGRSAEYTESQVKTALSKLGYSDEIEEIAIAIYCNEEVANKLGLDKDLIKKYRGYPAEHNAGYGGSDHSESYMGSDGGDSD